MTAAERLRQEGWQEGWQEGALHTTREVTLRVLGLRFGPLPETLAQEVMGADLATLDRYQDALFSCPNLDALLASRG
jgi:hypothetical protein